MEPHSESDLTQPRSNGKATATTPDIQERLRALVEAEEGTLKQQREEAERRLAEAQSLLAEARADVTREHERAAELEAVIEERGRERGSYEKKLAAAREQIEVLESQLAQATAGLEGFDDTRARLGSVEHKLEAARIEINRRGEDIATSERRAADARREAQEEMRGRLDAEKALEVERAQADGERTELRAAAEREAHVRAVAERSLERVREEAAKLFERLEAVDARAEALEEKRAAQAEELEQERAARAAESERAAELQRALSQQMTVAVAEVKGSRRALEGAHVEVQQAKAELGNARDRISELEQALSELRSRAAGEREEWRSALDQQAERRAGLERQLGAAMDAERTAQENQAALHAKLQETVERASAAESRLGETERELADVQASLGRLRERAEALDRAHKKDRVELERKLTDAIDAAAKSRKAAERLGAELEKSRHDAEHARAVAQERAAAEDAERQNRLETERQLEEVLSDGRRQEQAVASVERRVAEALDRRLKATVESGTKARALIEKQEATISARSEEIAHLEQRIASARKVLSELAKMGADREQEQSVLADRLDQIAQVLGTGDAAGDRPPPPPAAPALPQAPPRRNRRARASAR